MHDIRMIRETPEVFDAAMKQRKSDVSSSDVLAIDAARRAKISAAEEAKAAQNAASKQVGAAKASGDEAEFERLRALVGEKKAEVARLNDEAKAEDDRLTQMLMGLPNIPMEGVPEGTDEEDNVEIHHWGTPRRFPFVPTEHFELTSVQGGMNFALGAKLSGARFVVLQASIARLHRALAQFMLDTHVSNGLTEVWTPVLVREEMMYGTGQLPKFGEDSYQTTDGWWMIPTSEVTLTNLVNGETLEQRQLPLRMTAHSQCFRSEAGHGRDAAPAPVREGRDGVDHQARRQPRRAGPHDGLCAGHPRRAAAALPHRGALHRRHGVRRAAHP